MSCHVGYGAVQRCEIAGTAIFAGTEGAMKRTPKTKVSLVKAPTTDDMTQENLIQDNLGRETFRQFIHHATAFGTRMQAIRKALGRAIGLSATQFTILVAIARRERKGGIGLNDIAERLHFT